MNRCSWGKSKALGGRFPKDKGINSYLEIIQLGKGDLQRDQFEDNGKEGAVEHRVGEIMLCSKEMSRAQHVQKIGDGGTNRNVRVVGKEEAQWEACDIHLGSNTILKGSCWIGGVSSKSFGPECAGKDILSGKSSGEPNDDLIGGDPCLPSLPDCDPQKHFTDNQYKAQLFIPHQLP